jgi:heme-degrading monooxygenase HmoA
LALRYVIAGLLTAVSQIMLCQCAIVRESRCGLSWWRSVAMPPPAREPRLVATGRAGIMWHMTVVKINAITVPAGSGDELARRFAARAGEVDDQEGFEGFELLKPADERATWLVVTRWRDEAAFQAWLHSPAFGHGHRSAAERSGGAAPPPVGVSSELWSYEIAGGSAAS